MKVFLDSSALAKRYIEEPGSARIAEICTGAEELAASILCITEVLAACNRFLREKAISEADYTWIKDAFLLDIGEITIIGLTFAVIASSISCLEKGAIRSPDALHIAAALAFRCDLLVTGDLRQTEPAARMGVPVELV
jgi:hypothetical protein